MTGQLSLEFRPEPALHLESWHSHLRLVIAADIAQSRERHWSGLQLSGVMRWVWGGLNAPLQPRVAISYPGVTHARMTGDGSRFHEAWSKWAKRYRVGVEVRLANPDPRSRGQIVTFNPDETHSLRVDCFDSAYYRRFSVFDILRREYDLNVTRTPDLTLDDDIEEYLRRGLFTAETPGAPDEVVVLRHGRRGWVQRRGFRVPSDK